MQGRRDFANALVIALISIGLIVGALSISLVEFVPEGSPTSNSALIPSPAPVTVTERFAPTATATFSNQSPTPSVVVSSTTTTTPPANCQIPPGWGQISVSVSDSLESIAARYRVSSDDLRRANCLFSNTLVTGSKIYVPPVASSTPAACVSGAAGWVKDYTVRAGENLYRIAVNHYTTLELMRKVNCRIGDTIFPGEVLWVPNVSATATANSTLAPGSTATPYPTDPLTETALPFTATYFPTHSPIPP